MFEKQNKQTIVYSSKLISPCAFSNAGTVGNRGCLKQHMDAGCGGLWWIMTRVQILGLEHGKCAKERQSNCGEERCSFSAICLVTMLSGRKAVNSCWLWD